jgi:toxin ParE1/3/4
MRRFEVRMTADAVRDLEEIVDRIARHDGPDRAQHVLDRIQAALDALKRFPERGTHPAELVALGIREYRETFFKPYRIVYHVEGARVFISLIADGRRDMRSLLARRLLAG